MDALSLHYHQLVGLNSDWAISDVQLDVQNRTLILSLEFVGTRVVCPECGAACAMKDHAAARSWRHLDAMQFQTTLTARIPRCSCSHCRVRTILVPWAGFACDEICHRFAASGDCGEALASAGLDC
jgi:transposase